MAKVIAASNHTSLRSSIYCTTIMINYTNQDRAVQTYCQIIKCFRNTNYLGHSYDPVVRQRGQSIDRDACYPPPLSCACNEFCRARLFAYLRFLVCTRPPTLHQLLSTRPHARLARLPGVPVCTPARLTS